MGNIVLLDDLTINKIAAGEVIERPANVVKELVENSIDAGADNVIIEIKKGGKTFIKVTDNGSGINRDDISNSFERHATSKIRRVEDLEKTYTMGFRGEALASISSVSKLTMSTKTKDDKTGLKVYAEAGEIQNAEEVVMQDGTNIVVEELFYNTPVRYKFLKQDSTEFKYIKELIQNMALSNLNVSFKLINDGKNVFYSSGNGNIRDILYVLYGKDIKDNLIDVNYEEDNIKITGVVGNTFLAKDNRKSQIIFLNKRNIKDQIILNSADQAFKGATGIGKYGFFVLNLEMPATFYDVNVHPTKMQVRFNNEERVYQITYRAIKGAILSKDFLGNEESSEKKEYVNNEYSYLTNHFSHSQKVENSKYFEKSNNIDSNNKDVIFRVDKRNINYKFIGISFKTYIIIEIDNEIYLIDQHAAHERVLYEQIKENFKNNIKNNSQMTLIPEIINLTHKEMEFVQNNIELIKNYGFDIEYFGDSSVKINGVPDIEYRAKTNNKEVFLDILDEMTSNIRSPIKDIEERFIATVACKAAVKAGMDLTEKEVDNLMQKLLILQNPYTCPHGRPTTIKLNKSDFMEK